MRLVIHLPLVLLSFIYIIYAQTDITGNITVDTTWTVSGSPYRIGYGSNPDNVIILNGAELIINPGVTILLDEDARLTVGGGGLVNSGMLVATGTEDNPILFTRASIGVRHWGVRFGRFANDNSVMSYCIVEYGYADGSSPDDHGGGILIQDCEPLIMNNTIRYCCALRNGGGIYVFSSSETDISPQVIENHVFADSSGTGYDGGGIAVVAAGLTLRANIKGNTVEQCYSPSGGGGIWLDAGSGINSSIIENNIIINNTAANLGGGIKVEDLGGGEPRILRNLIASNVTATYGGGIYVKYPGNPLIHSNIIVNNSAQRGGGAYMNNSVSGFANNTVYENSASNANGGIWLGGLSDVVQNCIIFNNGITPITAGGTVQYSCIEGGYAGTGNISSDPQFIDAANEDFRLAWNSPCIDAGAGASVVADFDSNAVNQDGDNNGIPAFDMGAFEFLQKAVEFTGSSGTMSYTLDTYETGSANTVAQVTLNSPVITPGNSDSIFVDVYTGSRPFAAPPASRAVSRWIEVVRQPGVGFGSADLRLYYGQEEFDRSDMMSEDNLSIYWYTSTTGKWYFLGADARSADDNYVQVNSLGQGYFSTEFGTTYFALSDAQDKPLPVSLISFRAANRQNAITVTWETSSELNNAGFELYRAEEASDHVPFRSFRDSEQLIGMGSSSEGRVYTLTDHDINQGHRYSYKLFSLDYGGTVNFVGVTEVVASGLQDTKESLEFELLGNYPNPFNSRTVISFSLKTEADVTIQFFTVTGRKIEELRIYSAPRGRNHIPFAAPYASSGVYIYRINARTDKGEMVLKTGKMLLVN